MQQILQPKYSGVHAPTREKLMCHSEDSTQPNKYLKIDNQQGLTENNVFKKEKIFFYTDPKK